MVIGKIKISMEPSEIRESTPGSRLEIVHLLIVGADLIVSTEGRAQKKRRRKQIAYLCPIRLALSAYHSIDGKRVYERQLMGMKFGKRPKSAKNAPLCC
jgi:hypothetical protein